MPLSSRSRTRIPLFRSLSASAAKEKDNPAVAPALDSPKTTQSSLGGLGFSLPTLSTLANLNLHRRGRSKSNTKRPSLVSRHKSGDATDANDQQHVAEAETEERDGDGRREREREVQVVTVPPTKPTGRNYTSTANAHGHPHSISNPNVKPHSTSTSTSTSPVLPNLNLDSAATTSIRTTTTTTTPAGVGVGDSTSNPAASPSTGSNSSAQATPGPTPLATPLPTPTTLTPAVPSPSESASITPASSSSSCSACACADSNISSTTAIRHSCTSTSISTSTPSPKFLPHPTSTVVSPTTAPTDTISQSTPPPPPPPLLVVQRPSTPHVPVISRLDPDSHDTLPAMQRKIWVKRPGASPTRVVVLEDDLIDSVRDVILGKYANSLGRSIDSPDITLKIVSREPANKNISTERILGPEEPIGKTLDAYYPGGQTVDEALLIDVPSRRTPRASPRAGNHQISYFYPDPYRPPDDAREYFPPMPVHSPHLAHVQHQAALPHAMSVLTTGQLPPLPSPGSHGSRRHANNRPVYRRQHTSSPTIMHTVQPNGQVIETKSQLNGPIPSAPPLPTPPAQPSDHPSSLTPPNRVGSPHIGQKPKKKKNPNVARSANGDPISSSKPNASMLLDNSVPPINVLLVEDNVINLKLLEAFMKRLKVRWSSAMNGKEAVTMWRTGGFHLVLMDIQLPVMNGLEATKEIRRLEAVNGIGVFSGSPIESGLKIAPKTNSPVSEADTLPDRNLFKSPVIIVALTASSLQSDRHEALAAGCNDFLTKPVNFVWMERKVTEWGCMQALIDYDGWRKWKQYAQERANADPAKKAAEEKEEKAKAKAALKAFMARPPPSVKKDSGSTTTTSSTTIERSATPTQNGTAAKKGGGADEKKQRSHKSSRSSTSIGTPGGNLESMAEEDEKAS